MSFVGLWICLVSGGLCATNAGRRHLNVSNAWSNGRRCFQLVDRQPATTRSSARRLNFTESSHRVQGANHATHHRPGPWSAAVGSGRRRSDRLVPARGHLRPARTGLRLRSAHCLVVGHASGTATARRGCGSRLPPPTWPVPATRFAPLAQTGHGQRSNTAFSAGIRRLTRATQSEIPGSRA